MSTLLSIREQLKEIYAKYSFYITLSMRFALGVLIFGLINYNVGFMKAASSVVVTIGLSVVCAFLPLIVMVLGATGLILMHLYVLSLPITLVAALFFILMYIFYFRFSSKKAWLVLLTAAGFSLQMPLVVPVAIGLLGSPVCLVPAVCGTFTYYMLHFVKISASSFKGEGGGVEALVDGVMTFTKQSLMNKEMWIMVAAVVLCVLVVYGIKSRGIDHSWKIATGAGAVTAIVIAVAGNVALGLHISYYSLFISGIAAIVVGLLLEILFLSVDYLRTEHLEFEDDEYHYYVKAVPKIGVTVPEKSVKHINERQDSEEREEFSGRRTGVGRKRENNSIEHTEELLLTRSLNKELGLDERPKDK
ncbi:hypothetical protein [Mediterraneibacter agrestimuris]|uniref:hypothetical protein n=1 Tax=Mediterraneibacter agrestimuris TaxID=2941333 RepID=UPI0020409932|nr:hypothetical protein [Mediterraneibacter agrestimuris]